MPTTVLFCRIYHQGWTVVQTARCNSIKALDLISVSFSVPSASDALSFFTHLCCVCRDHHRPESRGHLLSPLCSTWWTPSWAVGYWVWHMLWQTPEWSGLRKNAQFPSHYSLIYSFVINQTSWHPTMMLISVLYTSQASCWQQWPAWQGTLYISFSSCVTKQVRENQ